MLKRNLAYRRNPANRSTNTSALEFSVVENRKSSHDFQTPTSQYKVLLSVPPLLNVTFMPLPIRPRHADEVGVVGPSDRNGTS